MIANFGEKKEVKKIIQSDLIVMKRGSSVRSLLRYNFFSFFKPVFSYPKLCWDRYIGMLIGTHSANRFQNRVVLGTEIRQQPALYAAKQSISLAL